ncbi:copper amine oxidase N-terminal domain-containing protein [Paenibacillus sp. H1-7]|uniref:copper amine oxidase N-terminal domain-containing protein n=1 Tax=Paenibacillus sp. H1-7 TaxID=2282849 RepID=UPI001EF7655D|nr:copper amine oxidase N-terminal domain-containing protein [Paenibacillus sp. H1-7]ULL16953.1 copper amine oxidase N-terminal domain-containing protein [Paenibacillus sp. H1-7]
MFGWNKMRIAALLVALLLMVGCQPIDGFDPVKLFEQEAELASYEGSTSLKFEFDIDSAKFSETDELGIGYSRSSLETYELLNGLQLQMNEVKVNTKSGIVSGKGILTKAQLQIPFAYSVEGDKVVVQVEGARHPITLTLGTLTDELPYRTSEWYQLGRGSTGNEQERELTRKGLQLLVRNLPNTDSLSIQRNQLVDIHGSQATGTTVTFDVTGTQMPELIKKYLRSLTLDDKGLRELADSLFEYLKDKEEIGGRFKEWFTDKEVSVEGIYGVEKFLLATLTSIVTTKQQEIHISPDTRVHLNLFVDPQQFVRKADMSIQFKDELGGIKGGKIQFQMERWNLNGAVQPAALSSRDAVDIAQLDTPEAVLEQVDENSALYTFLKRDLKVTKKQFNLWLMSKSDFDRMTEGGGNAEYLPNGFTSDNIAYGQLRHITEQLGYKAEWDSGSNSVVVSTGKKEISFAQGSAKALVDGRLVDMGNEALFIHGVHYVPVRFLVEQLGGEVRWNPETPWMLTVIKN